VVGWARRIVRDRARRRARGERAHDARAHARGGARGTIVLRLAGEASVDSPGVAVRADLGGALRHDGDRRLARVAGAIGSGGSASGQERVGAASRSTGSNSPSTSHGRGSSSLHAGRAGRSSTSSRSTSSPS
jgi:hypothetical protein